MHLPVQHVLDVELKTRHRTDLRLADLDQFGNVYDRFRQAAKTPENHNQQERTAYDPSAGGRRSKTQGGMSNASHDYNRLYNTLNG